jgi:hypothetical protein
MPFTKGPRNPVIHFSDGVSVLALKRKNGDVLPCLVDTADYSAICSYRWFASSGHGRGVYVQASTFINRVHSVVYLHQLLTGGKHFDHHDNNGLNNRRLNLRIAGLTNNNRNLRLRLTSTSGYKGVSWNTSRNKWEVRVQNKFLGYFKDKVVAARTYDAAAIERFGEFAKTNFPQGVQQ